MRRMAVAAAAAQAVHGLAEERLHDAAAAPGRRVHEGEHRGVLGREAHVGEGVQELHGAQADGGGRRRRRHERARGGREGRVGDELHDGVRGGARGVRRRIAAAKCYGETPIRGLNRHKLLWPPRSTLGHHTLGP